MKDYITVEIGRTKKFDYDIVVELGRTKPLAKLPDLKEGDRIKLDKKANEVKNIAVDVFVNNYFIAKGRIIIIEGMLVVDIIEVIDEKNNVLNFKVGNIEENRVGSLIDFNRKFNACYDVFINDRFIARSFIEIDEGNVVALICEIISDEKI